MPGARPESSGPVCAVTAWRTSTNVVVGGWVGSSPLGVVGGAVSVTAVDGTGAAREADQRTFIAPDRSLGARCR